MADAFGRLVAPLPVVTAIRHMLNKQRDVCNTDRRLLNEHDLG
jgi:hypothetical protein